MTTISKLGIQGIRSFDHERLEVLDFERPVTLIVGPNGSGKTTIIECLKMASAGLLPPNARNGHGFIHDPQVARLPEVKAQIRMLFRTGTAPVDREICAIRSFQLTNKRVAGRVRPQYKALESVLRTMADDGSKASLSHRCADMDTQVPELMGVSRAVLESVIFCHQEDSSWPLQDAAAVKKKFDDIFGATRYTKALQNIKELQKEWLKVTRDRRADADLSQAHLDQASKLASQKSDRERAAEEMLAELQDMKAQIERADESTQDAQMQLAQHESCGVRVAELRSLIARVNRDREEAARSMQEKGQDMFKESLEELQNQVRTLQERVLADSEHKVRQARANLATGEGDYTAALDKARKLRQDMGETLAAAEMLSSRRADLASRLQEKKVQSVAALKAQLDNLVAETSRADRENRQRDATHEEALAATERSLREALLEASRNESRADDAQGAIRRLEEEAKTLMRAQPELDALVRQMREGEAALGAEGSDTRLRHLEKRQEEIGRRRHDLQYSITRKSSEVAQLEAQSDAHVEVDALRRRQREAESDLGSKLSEWRPRLVGLLGQMPEAAEAETQVMVELQQAQEQLQRMRQTCQEAQQRNSAVGARRGAAEADLRRLSQTEAKLAAELGIPAGSGAGAAHISTDFQARLAAQREQVELARKDLAMTESAKHMYEKFREKSRHKNACQFCRRGFAAGSNERAMFEESVEKLIVKIPQFLEESQRRLKEAQDELSRLDSQRPHWDRLLHLRQEITSKQKEVAALVEEERTASGALEMPERERKRLEERTQQCQDLRAAAATLQRCAQVVEELRSGVRAKEARLLGGNSKVSLQAERDELRKLQEQLGELGREEDAVRTQRDLLAKQQESLRTQLAEQKGRLQLLQSQVARRGDVDSELAARQAELQTSTEKGKRARATADSAGARANQLRQERTESNAEHRQRREDADNKVRALQRDVDSLAELEQSIEVMHGRVSNAEELKAKLNAADAAAKAAERELEGLRAQLEKEEERRKKREAVHEQLQANIRLKSLEAEAGRHEQELAGLMHELGGRDLEALRRAVEHARANALELQRRQAFCEGSLAQTRDAVRQLEVELGSPLYVGVEQRHREAIIKHESAAYAAKDLARYYAALDKALMKYHSMKMGEINKTIKEMWRRVYRGRDIDFVAIRSDTDEAATEEGGAAPAETVGRVGRSYNYRVVMVCGDAEMEMRGRCSAGQRVLASLIIRLALADSFCVHCGVLALDEPTTNLDAANIHGLAEALASLIESRRGRSRFQLIIITHDEDFVDHLSRLQVSDWYYHIQKDDQGCSRIERRDMRTLGAG